MLGLHALWRPGAGLSLWHDTLAPEPELPGPVAALLAGRRFSTRVAVIDSDGRRDFAATATLGVTAAVVLLDATRSLPAHPEIAWYRHLLDGVRRLVAAGAVTPTVTSAGGASLVRWQPVATPVWRSWSAVMWGAAPEIVTMNNPDPRAAVDDLVAELTDHLCRARLAGVRADAHRFGFIGDLLPGSSGDTVSPSRAGAASAAWLTWQASAGGDETTVVFRLHEPDETDEFPGTHALWRFQVCLRNVEGHLEPVAPHRLDPAQLDRVTTDLANAVSAFGPLRQAEPDRTSLDYLLTTDTVAELLSDGVSALGRAGFAVLLPRTIADVRPALSLTGRPVVGSPRRNAMVGLGAVRDFQWRLALGTGGDAVALTDADIDELARQKGDLVRVRGIWMRAEGAALTRAAGFIAAQRVAAAAGTPPDMGELLDLVTGDTERTGIPVTAVSGMSWLDDIADAGSLRPPVLPGAVLADATLRPYQQRGFEWLTHLGGLGVGAVLADDMGLGKTVQVIAVLAHERRNAHESAEDRLPTLVICPMSVIGNWQREIARFAPELTVTMHHGHQRATGKAFAARRRDTDVVITTFATATRDRELLSSHSWRRIVVDEAQHVKNVNTAAAKAIRTIPTEHRVALTGTPVENRLEDLRAVIDFVNPGLLGSASVFRARFAEPIERERDPAALRHLTRLTRPFILRREKTDPSIISDLPAKDELTVRANLTVEQAALYRAVVDELMEALKDKEQRVLRRRTVLAALTRLKQICNHPAHYLGDGSPITRRSGHRSGKVELLADIATTLVDEGDRALVFTQFAAFGEMLTGWLGELLDADVPLLHGGLSRTDRDAMVARFQTGDDAPPVLVATLKAGGTGLNLTAANHVIHVDRWWNPAVEDQATDRAYRIGQRRDVHVRRFVCVGTLEERIDDMIGSKRELSALTVATGESWLGDFGNDELYELFALRDEAVSE
ncbi:DEAD/DEAH box helicase [Gordonia sp. (in: high G+C Gram-positive bacteria)]|jgi:superfamily II DNA or RNA helicase|uniref:DEAD/DEAH box helicase n=1 Tax=Gordonia sp. (in: high G+C Gram-positive bacteria) TaxID=84139 RepID=UPI001DD693AC|nr:DEAD/DEAH box helicase [Gordonia sp. (in: high G+C Gram-positive bacteria)]MCB1296663.1 DEAD/DEAH box helicase [Gordonia sp. (in: high G+C Gram-positive bacteria)]HMS76343.1 DEAD/DEAH box helicase [Gordonia sp. (in: high G+C Gram-positive bacteria)]